MDSAYAQTVRLLLTIAPDVVANDIFAMKGGTAINLFVRDMPRLSIDIDVVYTPWHVPREQALAAISGELEVIAGKLTGLGLSTRKIASKDFGDTNIGGAPEWLYTATLGSCTLPRPSTLASVGSGCLPLRI